MVIFFSPYNFIVFLIVFFPPHFSLNLLNITFAQLYHACMLCDVNVTSSQKQLYFILYYSEHFNHNGLPPFSLFSSMNSSEIADIDHIISVVLIRLTYTSLLLLAMNPNKNHKQESMLFTLCHRTLDHIVSNSVKPVTQFFF